MQKKLGLRKNRDVEFSDFLVKIKKLLEKKTQFCKIENQTKTCLCSLYMQGHPF